MMSIVDKGKLLILLAFWALVSLADNLPWSARVIEQGRLLTLLARRALVSLADYLPLSARVHKKVPLAHQLPLPPQSLRGVLLSALLYCIIVI